MSATGRSPRSAVISDINHRLFAIVTASRPSRPAFVRYDTEGHCRAQSLGYLPTPLLFRGKPIRQHLPASSPRRRASFRPTSGYFPMLSFFCLPRYRYLSFQSLLPDGRKRRNSPLVSKRLCGMTPYFATLTAVSVNAIWGPTSERNFKWPPKRPPIRGGCPRTMANDGGLSNHIND